MVEDMEQIFEKPSVIIVGIGIVGHNLKNIFTWADCYDKYNDEFKSNIDLLDKTYDFCFIAVPTPMNKNGSANLDEVSDVIKNIKANIYVIKSTIPPGTTTLFKKKYNKHIIFSPEYDGNTQHARVNYDFVILGGDSNDTFKVSQLYQFVKPATFTMYQVDSTTAELCKYMENSFLACKVVFCNEFYRIAKKLNINYNVLRELFCLDPRINKSHTFVYEDYPFYDSKCFNKDLPAIISTMKKNNYNAKFIKNIISRNEEFKKDYKNKNIKK